MFVSSHVYLIITTTTTTTATATADAERLFIGKDFLKVLSNNSSLAC